MATRMKVNPPKTLDGDEIVSYTCSVCGSTIVTNPEAHIRDGMHDKDLILEGTSMAAWYKENNDKGEMYG